MSGRADTPSDPAGPVTEWRRGWRRRLGPVAWVVFEEVCDAADLSGEARVSARSLADALGLDKDTVARALRRLVTAGLVGVGNQHRAGGRFARGSYRVLARREPHAAFAAAGRSGARHAAPRKTSGRTREVGGQQSLFDGQLASQHLARDLPDSTRPSTASR